MMIKKFLFISGLALFCNANAQATHTVAKGDNPYSIAKKYGLSLDELMKMNPSAKDGKLAIGDVVNVNKKGKATVAPKKTPAEKPVPTKTNTAIITGKIILQPKQTIYGITKQYHISEAELRALNPNLDANMKIGTEITLPATNIKKYGSGQPVTETVVKPVAQEVQSVVADSYEVQPKDNYYRITKQFGITKEQLFALNPGLEARGLQPGDILKVKGTAAPGVREVREEAPTRTITQNPGEEYATYTVQEGDTVFGILNKFGISLDDLLSLNPSITGGLKTGAVLKIKKLDAAYVKKSGNALNVVMMLPFGFDTNDTKFRGLATDFLAGAKLAIERNARNGLEMDVKIIDAGNEESFKNSLVQLNKENTDIIIGPFLKSNVLEVLKYVNAKQIPVVAPFANAEDLYNYSNLIIVEPADNLFAERIAKEVAQVHTGQKIFILADSGNKNAAELRSQLEKNLPKPNVVIVNSAADMIAEKNMMTGKPAPLIAVLTSDDDGAGTAFANRVIALSKETNVKAFSMFYNSIFEKNMDELSQANLVYLMDRKINTDGDFEKEILAEYKKKYCKSPSKYAVIGFDVMNDVLMRENKRGEIFKQIGKVQTQLSTKFEYVRSKKNGAYINTGYRVVRLVP